MARAVAAARKYRQAHDAEIVRELVDLLSIPNVSADLENIRRNAEMLVQMMERRDIRARLIETGAAPVVYGELIAPGPRRTILFYCHYDGQAVEPRLWIESEPFRPVLRSDAIEKGGKIIPWPARPPLGDEWRIYARSASDDKSPIVALLHAIDALRAAGIPLSANIKFLLDGEEEAGSPHLEKAVADNRDLLKADVVIIADGPVHQSGQPTVYFGLRGITTAEITVYGPKRPLHSGHYGNWAPNPALRLARLLATMKDESGRVMVEGFYDDVEPLSQYERAAIAEIPANERALMGELGLAAAEGEGKRLPELLLLPSLNVRGLESGWVGEAARTIIPATATASIDMRLVKGLDHNRQHQRLLAHIRKQGYHVVAEDPDDAVRRKYPLIAKVVKGKGYNAVRTSMELEVSRLVISAVAEAAGRQPVKLPTLGGSGPLYMFPQYLGAPVIGLPTVNYDNNQHSPNENVRLGNLWQAIEIFAALMVKL